MHPSYIYALGSNLTFSISAVIYTAFSKRLSVMWINTLKASVALVASLMFLLLNELWQLPPIKSVLAFFFSGIIGLNIGDIFMLSAFTRIGPGRTMMLWGFQPFFMSVAAYFMFGHSMSAQRGLAVLFLIGCLFLMSFERYRQEGHWEVRGLVYALVGVTLDATGILLSRYGFDQAPDSINVMQGHFLRCLGAVTGFAIMSRFYPFHFFRNLKELDSKGRQLAFVGGFLGTFMALWLSLNAVKIGHLPSVTAVSVTTPLFTSLFEVVYLRRKPTLTMLLAFVLFLSGFYILVTCP